MLSKKVVYDNNTDCFVRFNQTIPTQTPLGNCVNVSWNVSSVVLWCVSSNIQDDLISINYLYAQQIGLLEGTIVYIKQSNYPPALSKIIIQPETPEDLEILEMNASKLQTCLLDQLRIVIKGQKMVCWVAPSLPIKIRSAHSSILQPHTEIAVILFQENQIEKDDTTINNNEINNMHYYASSIYESTLKDSILSDNTVFRAVIFPTIDKNYHIFDVYTFNNATNMKENNVYILMNMENNNPAREKDKSDQNEDIIVKQLYVRVKLLMNNPNIKEVDLMSPYPPLMISKSIANLMNLESGSKLVLEEIIQHFPTPNVIEISPVNHLTPDLEKYFKMFISNQSSPENSILINQDTVLNLSPIKDIWCQVKLYPANMQFALLSGDSLSECKVISNQNLIQPSEDRISFKGQIDSEEFCRNISLFESIISNCIRDFKTEMLLKKNLHTHLKLRNHIFILGNPGSGKSSVSHMIVSELGCWYNIVGCRSIKGRKDIMDIVQRSIQQCERYSPSILILDDVDSLVPAEVEGTSHQDAHYYDTLAHSLKFLLKRCIGVNVILTAQSIDSLHSSMKLTKGDLICDSKYVICELNKEERWNAIKHIIKKSVYSTVNMEEKFIDQVAIETEGYNIRDLEDFVTKKIFDAVKNAIEYNEVLNMTQDSDVKNNIKTKEDPWKTIGGMKQVKKMLIETLCWPVKYPSLYPKQPGGILLFGAPGTGKSLIGSNVAKLNDLDFICIKGPELLSKYIGQSEQAVRDLFKKAEKRKPCVLFFDEFDSLASRRGQDSTGVTDRVVNQLLTQLDGVEGATKGVTVMAATSRPDLLDAALLRPGRFDTTIHCAMPQQEERLEILKILSTDLKLSKDVDLQTFSEITKGFTGADLRSFLSTAQLLCLEEKLELLEINQNDSITPDMEVNHEHLLKAFSSTRPSLTNQQLHFYDTIYARFLHKGVADIKSGKDNSFENRQRVTLA